MCKPLGIFMAICLSPLGGCFVPSSQPPKTELEKTVDRANAGSRVAQNKLGVIYADGTQVPVDHAEAAKWYRLSAEQGHAIAQYNLGLAYATGKGVPEDFVEAYGWLSVAVVGGAPGRGDLSRVEQILQSGGQFALGQRRATEFLEKYGS